MNPALEPALIAGLVSLLVAGVAHFGSEMYRRHRDSNALAGGLAGELGSWTVDFPATLEVLPRLANEAGQGTYVPMPRMARPKSPVFDSRVGDLGLLGPELAEDVAFVYGRIEAFRSMMEIVISDDTPPQQLAGALTTAHEMVRLAHERGMPLLDRLRAHARRPFFRAFGNN